LVRALLTPYPASVIKTGKSRKNRRDPLIDRRFSHPETIKEGKLMIGIKMRLMVQPEMRDRLLTVARGMLSAIRQTRGCVSCRFSQDIENENSFTLVEEWKSQQDMERHLYSEAFVTFLVLMFQLFEPPDIQLFKTSQAVGPAMAATALDVCL
jgi:quinol monooxygenase YgiN